MSVDNHGRFVWHELMTSDPAAAKTFYTAFTGWTTQEWADSPMQYTMWVANGTPIGGVLELPQDLRDRKVPTNWLTHISTRDVDATAAKAKQLGGKVSIEPTDIPTVGRFAILTDPSGAAFSIFKPEGGPPPSDDAPKVGEFSWHELTTNDQKQAFDFYSTLFGWVKTSEFDMGPMGVYLMFGLKPDVPLGGMMQKTPDMPQPPSWLPYIHVGDVTKCTETFTKLGGTVMHGPMEVPGGDMIVMAMDPQGGAFALHATKK